MRKIIIKYRFLIIIVSLILCNILYSELSERGEITSLMVKYFEKNAATNGADLTPALKEVIKQGDPVPELLEKLEKEGFSVQKFSKQQCSSKTECYTAFKEWRKPFFYFNNGLHITINPKNDKVDTFKAFQSWQGI